jgi:hypothetical protein
MPRPYNLADVFRTMGQSDTTALSPDTSDLFTTELINQVLGPTETSTTTDVATATILSSTSNQWGTATWGAFQWS